LAGDELADSSRPAALTPEIMDNVVATGFLRMAPDPTGQSESALLPDRITVITDEIQVFGSAVLGLTVHCAPCHDHKLEPSPQRDYYRLRAVFKGALDEYDWMVPENGSKEKPARLLPYAEPWRSAAEKAEQDKTRNAQNVALSAQIGKLRAALAEKAKPLEKE